MTMTSSTTQDQRSSDLRASLDLFEVKPGVQFSVATLRDLLPDVETVLFFGKVYKLDANQLATLIHVVINSDLSSALFAEGGEHSNELQDYLLDGWLDTETGEWHEAILDSLTYEEGDIEFSPDVPRGEILPEVWKSLEVEVANSIAAVAAKLESVVNLLPGKQGSMVFNSMMKLNAKRPTIGDFRAKVHHEPVKENMVILDVSGSMNADTVGRIVEDVVALSYMANAHMAIVSSDTTYWEPGTYSVQSILDAATYGGTHYETLLPLFTGRDWGVVITVADYDSSPSAQKRLAKATGRIDLVLDISLVNRPTFLAECVGQLADETRPLLIGNSAYVLS
jgi:hypothetical protein